jgi:hypothetical protein
MPGSGKGVASADVPKDPPHQIAIPYYPGVGYEGAKNVSCPNNDWYNRSQDREFS